MATLVMSAKITFPAHDGREKLVIRKISEVEIESAWKDLTDTATITLARNVKFFDRRNVKEVFKRNDPVLIELGYGEDENLVLEFSGYIKKVSADYPITIECEDEMFKVKQIPINFSHPDISLENLIKKIIPDYEVDVLEGVQLGAVRYSKKTVGEVLEDLQEKKLYSYVEPGTKQIVIGKVYADNSNEKPFVFDLERNVVSNDLNYKRKEDTLVKVNGQAINRGAKIEFSYGDDNPNKTIDWQFVVKTLEHLKERVIRLYKANKKDGFDGSFDSFGIPSVKHGRKVAIRSLLYPDRKGTFYIDRVQKIFSSSEGYRQTITVGNLFKR